MSRPRRRPAPPQDRPSPHHNNSSDYIGLPGYQRTEPLTPADRADFDVILAATERGFRISVKCTVCGHWLSNPRSVSAFLGPRCRARMAASE